MTKIASFLVGSLIIFQITLSYGKEIALKDLKNVYINVEAETKNPFFKVGKADIEKIRKRLGASFAEMGFNTVDNLDKAEFEVKWHYDKVVQNFELDVIDAVWVEFIVPKYNFVFSRYEIGREGWGGMGFKVSVKKAEEMLFYKIKKDYKSEELKFQLNPDGRPEKIKKSSRILSSSGVVKLKDIKNVYLDYDIEINPKSFQMQFSDMLKYREKFGEKLQKFGFNIVDNKYQADVKIVVKLKDVNNALATWSVNGAILKMFLPDDSFKILAIKTHWVYTSIDKADDALIEKLSKIYTDEKPIFSVTSDGRPEKIKPYIRTVLNGEIIYSGEEKIDNDFWANPILPFNSLDIEGNQSSANSIGIIAYNTYLSPLTAFYNREEGIIKVLNNEGILISKPQPMDKLIETYGYAIRYDMQNKIYKVCFFVSILDDLKNFSEDDDPGDANPSKNHVFQRDISYLLSSKIKDYFASKNYKVIDFTPARLEFNNLKIKDVIQKIATVYKVDKIIVIPYSAYTKYVRIVSPGPISGAPGEKTTMVGFFLFYNTYIYENNNIKPIFKFSNDMEAIPAIAANTYSTKIDFFSAELDDKGEVKILKDGVINDEWIVEKTIRKFAGYEKGLNEKEKIGGYLFDKLSEEGF